MNRSGLPQQRFAILSSLEGRLHQSGGKRAKTSGGEVMLDIIFLTATALFVGVAILYVRACERLR